MTFLQMPEGRSGKAVAVLIGLGALIVLQFVIVSPVFSYYGVMAQELQDRWDATERSRSAVAELPQLKSIAESLRQKTRDKSLILDGASDARAAANLQSMLKDIIEQQGSKLISVQTLQPEPEGRFQRIGLRVSITGSLTAVTTVLSGIETSHPVLSISNFDLRGSGEDEDQTLSVAMDVYGFRPQ